VYAYQSNYGSKCEVFLCLAAEDTASNPQTLLFSATLPHWVHETAKKYLRPDRRHFDLVCDDTVKTSKTVRVGSCYAVMSTAQQSNFALSVCYQNVCHVVYSVFFVTVSFE